MAGDLETNITLITKAGRSVKLIELIDAGAFGQVWVANVVTAHGLQLESVAIKFIAKKTDNSDTFSKEYDTWTKIGPHNNVLRFKFKDETDGYYLFCSVREMSSLEKWLEVKMIIDISEACRIVTGILSGLIQLKKHSVVHRDLKDKNVLMGWDDPPTPKIADFGISRVLLRNKTHSYTDAIGTLPYMAPEILKNGKFSYRSDIWAVGVIFYQLLNKNFERPFNGNFVRLINSIQNDEPADLPSNVPPELKKIVKKSLSKDIKIRYKDASAMLKDLGKCVYTKSSLTFTTPALQKSRVFWKIITIAMIFVLLTCAALYKSHRASLPTTASSKAVVVSSVATSKTNVGDSVAALPDSNSFITTAELIIAGNFTVSYMAQFRDQAIRLNFNDSSDTQIPGAVFQLHCGSDLHWIKSSKTGCKDRWFLVQNAGGKKLDSYQLGVDKAGLNINGMAAETHYYDFDPEMPDIKKIDIAMIDT